MKQITLIIIPTLFFYLISCSQTIPNNVNNQNINNWNTHDEKDYSIQYPDNWQINKSGFSGANLILLTNLSSGQDKFNENMNLIIQNLTGKNIDLDKFVEISESQVRTMIKEGKIIESVRLNANGKSFHKIIYTGSQGAFNLKFEQYYWIQSEKAYILTLTCEFDQFETYREIGEKIMNSFRIK
jgi:hypothetical protein